MDSDRLMKVLLVVCVLLVFPDLILAAWKFGLFPSVSTFQTLVIEVAAGAVVGLGAYIGFLSSKAGGKVVTTMKFGTITIF